MNRCIAFLAAVAWLTAPAGAQQTERFCADKCYGEASYCSKSCPSGPDFVACDARCAGQKQVCLNACPLEKPPQPWRR